MPFATLDRQRPRLPVLWLLVVLGAAAAAFAQDGFRDALGLKSSGKKGGKPSARFSVDLAVENNSGEVVLSIRADIPEKHYIYSLSESNGGAETTIDIDDAVGLVPLDDRFTADHSPKVVPNESSFDEEDLDLPKAYEKFYQKVTWTRRYKLAPGTDLADVAVVGLVRYQICLDQGYCVPNQKHPFRARLTGAREATSADDARPAAPALRPRSRPAAGGPRDVPALDGDSRDPAEAIQFSLELAPTARDGDFDLRITARLEEGYYTHSTSDTNGGAATSIEIDSVAGLEPVDDSFRPDREPQVEDVPASSRIDEEAPTIVEKYLGAVTWTQRYRLLPDADPADVRIKGTIRYQLCRAGLCLLNQQRPFEVTLAGEVAVPAAQVPPAEFPPQFPKPGEVVADPVAPDEENGDAAEREQDDAVAAPPLDGRDRGLLWFVLSAFGFGFAALLTPCSFPMVPITVSFFHKQAEKQGRLPVAMALVYCGGIIGAFTVLGIMMSALFGPAFLNQLANNPWMNTALALLLVFFALNLLGLFEIRVPGWLLTFSATQEGRGGYVGVLFMALTFTLTSFTCTFAFVGGLLVEAAAGDRLWPAIGLFAFSAAFSLPFFFLALFPGLLQKLPRSGNWMNAVKVVMGLVELGAAFKFFSVADLGWNPTPLLFDYELVLSAWMIISIAAALYLLGMFRLPHDMPSEHVGVLRFVTALSFMGLAAYLAVGLYSEAKPAGQVWGKIAAWAPPRLEGGTEQFGPVREHGGIKFALDFQRAVQYAAEKKKPLFIDFTGVNCTNCREMEEGPMSKPQIVERLKNFVCVQVFADRVPVIPDRAERARLLEFNINLQTNWFRDPSLPSYAVIPPDPDIAEGNPGEKLLARFGYNLDEGEFARFLDRGLSRWKQLQAQGGAPVRVVGRR